MQLRDHCTVGVLISLDTYFCQQPAPFLGLSCAHASADSLKPADVEESGTFEHL